MLKPTLRWSLICLLSLITVVLLLCVSLSWTAPIALKHLLARQNLDFDIEKSSINIFKGSLVFDGISISASDSSEKLLLGNLSIRCKLADLASDRQITCQKLSLHDLKATLVKLDNHYSLAGIAFPLGGSESVQETKFEPASETTADGAKPRISLSNLSAHNIEITLTQNTQKPLQLTLSKFSADHFSNIHTNTQTHFDGSLLFEQTALDASGWFANDFSTADQTAEQQLFDINLDMKSIESATLQPLIDFFNADKTIKDTFGTLAFKADAKSSVASRGAGDALSFEIVKPQISVHQLSARLQNKDVERLVDFSGVVSANHIQYRTQQTQIEITALELLDGDFAHRQQQQGTGLAGDDQELIALELNDLSLKVSSISNVSDTLADFEAQAKMGDYGKLIATGKFHAFSPLENAKVDLTGEQINLLPFSGLVEQFIDRQINSGLMSFESNVVLSNLQLNAQNQFRIDQLKLKRAKTNAEDQDKAQQELKLGLPLNTALNLLRDNNDRIELRLPVSGSVNDPEFNLQPTIRKALFKSIRTGVTTQVGPLLALSVLGKARDFQDALKLKPIVFDLNSDALSDDAMLQIDKIANFLERRKAVSIRLCPVSLTIESPQLADGASSDKLIQGNLIKDELIKEKAIKPGEPENSQAIDALSERRLERVKTSLIEKGINGQRLVPCASEIESNADATPRIKLSF